MHSSPLNLPESFNVATHFVDRNVLEGRGDKIAIECGADRIRYQRLLEQTNRAGNRLRNAGVRPGERVLLLLLDSPEFLYYFFGAIKIGAVPIPTNPFLKPDNYEYLLNDSQARVVVTSEPLAPQIRCLPPEKLGYLSETIAMEDGKTESASPQLEAEPTGRDTPAFWLYSSGTTGSPKACIHLHRDMVVSTELYAKAILGMNETDRCYSVARLFFAYGLGNAGYFPLGCGATTILSPARPTPAGVYADVERYRPTLFFSVPSNYAELLAYASSDGRNFDLSSVRHAISAGEALPAPVFERFKKRFAVEILDALGSTETLQMVISNRPDAPRAGSSGKVIPGYEAKILDENGKPVPRGEIGNLFVKGDSICAGYWNQPEKTKQVFEGEWYRTGDKYYQDEDGYMWYAGRSDDTFKVNGRWLSPAEVESSLVAHPAVREAAVVERNDENGLTKPAAYVVVNPEFAAGEQLSRELQEWVAQKAGSFKRPRWIEYLPALPRTATGKLQRFKLRELQAQQSRPGERGTREK